MNFSPDNFGSFKNPLDLALYAGVLVVVYVLFKDNIHSFFNKVKEQLKDKKPPSSISDYFSDKDFVEPPSEEEMFFELVQSWKKTRDLAEDMGAIKAVEIADQMFPFLVSKQEDNHE